MIESEPDKHMQPDSSQATPTTPTTPTTPKEVQHDRVANLSHAWQMSADRLLASAATLRRAHETDTETDSQLARPQLAPVELMLLGMALECLLKALWLKQGNKLSVRGTFVGIPHTGSHDLLQIADRVGFKRTDIQSDVLRRLTHFIEYGGRYPMPKRASTLALVRSPRGGRSSPLTWSTPVDDIALKAIIVCLHLHLS